MTEEVISFFDCAPASWEDHLSVMPETAEEEIITVRETEQTAYTYMEQAARSLARWITVTAEQLRSVVASRVRTFVRNIIQMTGVQILRKCAILRI